MLAKVLPSSALGARLATSRTKPAAAFRAFRCVSASMVAGSAAAVAEQVDRKQEHKTLEVRLLLNVQLDPDTPCSKVLSGKPCGAAEHASGQHIHR